MPVARAIGVDVGGTTIKAGVVDADGAILHRGTPLPTDAHAGPDAVLGRIAMAIEPLLEAAGGAVSGIGIGVPGVINERGEISYPPNFPGWEIVPVAERIRPILATTLPITVENDANVAAYAETRAGSGSHDRDFLFVTLGTGIGGCIISAGRIWRGVHGGAGELGHISVDLNGPQCNCGSRGCVEAYVGQRYMTSIAAERLADELSASKPQSMLHAMIERGAELSPKLIDEAAGAGDAFAQSFLREMGEILGAALASAMNLLDMHLVIVGGGMSRSEQWLLEPARESMRRRVLRSIADAELRTARFSNDAGIIGAGLLAVEEK